MAGSYLIAIASYRRPSALRQLLDSLYVAANASPAIALDVVVVDNDVAESARPVAAKHRLGVAYVVEPEPGIAAARNRALKLFLDHHLAIIFVDDDERVAPDWLTTLTSYAERTRADVVQGPVLSVFPPSAPRWITRGGFIQRQVLETGKLLPSAATNNTLLRREAWLRAGAPSFDPSFSMTGGSDAEFFWGVRKAGARIIFCAEAIVWEDVPVDRLTLTWLRRRAVRKGVAETRLRRKHHDLSATWLLGSCLRTGYGLVVLMLGLGAGRGLRAQPFDNLFKGWGRVAALFDYRVLEYARPSRPVEAP